MSIREDIEKVQNKVEEIEHQSLAMEILREQKKSNKRLFVALIVVLCMWFVTIGYLVYVLNDIEYIETTDNDSIEIEEVESIDNTHIKIGDDIWEKSQ